MSSAPSPASSRPLQVSRRPPSPARVVSQLVTPALPSSAWASTRNLVGPGARAGGGQGVVTMPSQGRSLSTSAPVAVYQLPKYTSCDTASPRAFSSAPRVADAVYEGHVSASTRRSSAFLSTTPLVSPTSAPQYNLADLGPHVVPAMPDMCAVCGATDTPEWRRGPAGLRSLCNGCGIAYAKRLKDQEARGAPRLSTVEEIERELEAIGLERFKKDQHRLPSGTRERILVTQERTRCRPAVPRQPKTRKESSSSQTTEGGQVMDRPSASSSSAPSATSRKGSTKLERTALGVLVDFRRSSAPSTTLTQYRSSIAPCSPPASALRGRRSGSGEESYFPSNVGASGGSGLPPSSSYMLPAGGVGPASTFSFGRTPSPAPTSAKSVITSTSSRDRMSVDVSPEKEAPSLFYKASMLPSGLVRPAPPFEPERDVDPLARRMSKLAASTNRMSIAYLTASSARAPSPPPSPPPLACAPSRPQPSTFSTTSTSAPRRAPSPVRWEAPQPVETRLERATSALRRRSSTIVGVKSPRLAAPPPPRPRASSPSLSRRSTG
ncbi:hypothetical protein JCM3775_007064 [Rhodotorula graminis]